MTKFFDAISPSYRLRTSTNTPMGVKLLEARLDPTSPLDGLTYSRPVMPSRSSVCKLALKVSQLLPLENPSARSTHTVNGWD